MLDRAAAGSRGAKWIEREGSPNTTVSSRAKPRNRLLDLVRVQPPLEVRGDDDEDRVSESAWEV